MAAERSGVIVLRIQDGGEHGGCGLHRALKRVEQKCRAQPLAPELPVDGEPADQCGGQDGITREALLDYEFCRVFSRYLRICGNRAVTVTSGWYSGMEYLQLTASCAKKSGIMLA